MALPTLLCEAANSCFSSLISSCALFKSSCNIEHRCSKLSDFSTAAFLAAVIDSSFARISETRRKLKRREREREGEGREDERGREREGERKGKVKEEGEGEEYPGTTDVPLVSTLLLWAFRNCFVTSALLRDNSSHFCCKDLRANSAEAQSFSN